MDEAFEQLRRNKQKGVKFRWMEIEAFATTLQYLVNLVDKEEWEEGDLDIYIEELKKAGAYNSVFDCLRIWSKGYPREDDFSAKARRAAARIGKVFLPQLMESALGNDESAISAVKILGEIGEVGEGGEIVKCIFYATTEGKNGWEDPALTEIQAAALIALKKIAKNDYGTVRRILRRMKSLWSESFIDLLDEYLKPVLGSFLKFLRERLPDDYFLQKMEKNRKIMDYWNISMRKLGERTGVIRSFSEMIFGMAESDEDRREFRDTLAFLCLLKLFPEVELSEESIARMRKAVEELDSIIEMNLQRIVNELKAGKDWTCADAISSNIVSQVRRTLTAEGEMRSLRARSRIGMRKADDKNSLRAQRRAA